MFWVIINGNIDKIDKKCYNLIREELNFYGIFNSSEIGKLIKDIEDRM
jgi:hypothetical protein